MSAIERARLAVESDGRPFDAVSKVAAVLDSYSQNIRRGLVSMAASVRETCDVDLVAIHRRGRPGASMREAEQAAIFRGVEQVRLRSASQLIVCVDALKPEQATALHQRWTRTGDVVPALVPLNSAGAPLIWAADLFAFASRERPSGAFSRQLLAAVTQGGVRPSTIESASNWAAALGEFDPVGYNERHG